MDFWRCLLLKALLMALLETACICDLRFTTGKDVERKKNVSYDSELGHSPIVLKLVTSPTVLKTQTDTSVHINAELG